MRFSIWADTGGCYSSSYDWQLIHAPENFHSNIYGSPIEQNKAFAYNIRMEKEMNRAGSLSFTITSQHPVITSNRRFIILGTTIALTTPTNTLPVTTTAITNGSSVSPIMIDGESVEARAGLAVTYDGNDFWYNGQTSKWVQFKDIGHIVWIGRILTIEKTFNKELNVTCEGALAFLNDIMVRPRQFFDTSAGENSGKSYKISAIELLDMIFKEYNQKMSGYPKRKFATLDWTVPAEQLTETTTTIHAGDTDPHYQVAGEENPRTAIIGTKVHSGTQNFIYNGNTWENYYKPPGHFNEAYYTGIDDYVSTFDKVTELAGLEPSIGVWAECSDDYTYEITLYFQYLPRRYNPSHIIFANNLVDFQDNGDGLETYTSVIPLGANKLRMNDNATTKVTAPQGYAYWLPAGDMYGGGNEFGCIEKTVDFSDATDSQTLSQMAQAHWLAYNAHHGKSYTISAVDLSLLNEIEGDGYNPLIITDPDIVNNVDINNNNRDYMANNFINIGDGVTFKSTPHGESHTLVEFVCSAISMDVDNPGASNYTFQIYDNAYVPSKPKLLTEYYARQQAIAEGKINADGTINRVAQNGSSYASKQEPTAVYRDGDNDVYAQYPEYQMHYHGEGTGDERTDLTEEKVAADYYTPTTPDE